MNEIREDMLKVKRMMIEVELILGKREGETELVNKLIDAQNLLTYCMSRLENAIVPPCKVGDTVYYLSGKYEKQGRKNVYVEFVDKAEVDNIVIGQKGVPQIDVCNSENEWTMFDSEDDLGKIVFIGDKAKEEAEKALAERNENK